jgi:hypothetical protein
LLDGGGSAVFEDLCGWHCCVESIGSEGSHISACTALQLQDCGQLFEADAYAVVRPTVITELVMAAA